MEKIKQQIEISADRISKFIVNTNKTGREKRSKAFLTARIRLLESYWTQFVKLYDDIYNASTPEQILEDDFFSMDLYSNSEQTYTEAVAWLNDELLIVSPPSSEDPQLNSTTYPPGTGATTQPVHLPKISLPTFTGSYLEWPTFHDTYVSLIHENRSLSNIQRMHYLKSSLSGEASKLIQHLSSTEANYSTAWNILLSRFNNVRVLVSTNLASLINIPGMSAESPGELRRVLDNYTQCVRALTNLKRPTDHWDDWLVYFMSSKLDLSTRKDWETSLSSSREVPAFTDLEKFLESRIHTLDALAGNDKLSKRALAPPRNTRTVTRSHYSSTTGGCGGCNGKHSLIFCPLFRPKSVYERTALLQNKKLCHNCLKPNHFASTCPSTNRCKQCNQRHHTMIHRTTSTTMNSQGSTYGSQSSSSLNCHEPNVSNTSPPTSANNQTSSSSATTNPLLSNMATSPSHQTTVAHFSAKAHTEVKNSVLLATAVVYVQSSTGVTVKARALLDQGSESNFITASLANTLHLPKQRVNISVTGIGTTKMGVIKESVNHKITSAIDSKYSYSVTSLILPTLTQLIPSRQVVRADWKHITGLPLADSSFNIPSRIDLILGAEIYAKILQAGIRHGGEGTPVAQCTTLGWIVSGGISTPAESTTTTLSCHSSTADLDMCLRKFWETEEPPKISPLSPEEAECERFYSNNHSRNAEGRFVVRLPIKSTALALGNSRQDALMALHRMERRFFKDSTLHDSYSKFMQEYLELNHMALCDDIETEPSQPVYYLPHHAVMKPSSTTTKLRVVFNASQKTSTGLSLNDILHAGPKLQNDIFVIIMRWRLYPYVFSADIEKMYRQILVHDHDTDMQRILWRSHPDDPVQTYRLTTVTYGTASAPYLACRTLLQLANDYKFKYPNASKILAHNFYVDDALFGAYDKVSAVNLRDELRHLLSLAGFNLRKWMSNLRDLVADIPESDREISEPVQFLSDLQIKTLGIIWNPLIDSFGFKINLPQSTSLTKRSVLADISRIYDPLGWLSPTTVTAKLILQQLWLLKVEWDDDLPDNSSSKWVEFKSNLAKLNDININRWVGTTTGSHEGLELHGFCDASLSAYGAVVYLRIPQAEDVFQVSLMAAKTRVSPIKSVSLPRLELCGATLLAELLNCIQHELHFENVPMYAWSDSTVALAWLRDHPSKWKVYVANRVALIHEKIPKAIWRHVPSHENPADCISRGITADALKTHILWWTGPPWLAQDNTHWPRLPSSTPSSDASKEMRPNTTTAFIAQNSGLELLQRYSNLRKLLRVTAYCYRFYNNLKLAIADRTGGPLSTAELNFVLFNMIKQEQKTFFSPEINDVCRNRLISSKSKLLNLKPYLDSDEILRTGGRLKNSLLPYEEQCPIILPKESILTDLIIKDAHSATLHGGIQQTLQHIRTKYWIPSGRSRVRYILRKCIICCRYKATPMSQLMGDLPASRIRPSKPFTNTGVDYAGPFNVRPFKGRGCKSRKSYVAIFICLATRAIHLELVMDLSSEAFIAAFKRFVSRRGKCSKLYSDNATCFRAADKELSSHFSQLRHDSAIAHFLVDDGTDWIFIPPSAPHFGGLWEAGVKSFKFHMRRVINDHSLTIEEMLTFLSQTEACLNSRPLHALTDDPQDNSVLTPGHFLVGDNILTVPATKIEDKQAHLLKRWQFVQLLTEHFWQRWHKDYLNHLQQRQKWCHKQESLQLNELVLIKDERLPPSKWLLGRVVDVHPGSDGHVRVVTLRYKDGYFKRPITKLIRLPVDTNSEP